MRTVAGPMAATDGPRLTDLLYSLLSDSNMVASGGTTHRLCGSAHSNCTTPQSCYTPIASRIPSSVKCPTEERPPASMEQFLTEALDAFDEDDTRRPEDSVAHGQTTQVANRVVAGRDAKAQEAHACSLGSLDALRGSDEVSLGGRGCLLTGLPIVGGDGGGSGSATVLMFDLATPIGGSPSAGTCALGSRVNVSHPHGSCADAAPGNGSARPPGQSAYADSCKLERGGLSTSLGGCQSQVSARSLCKGGDTTLLADGVEACGGAGPCGDAARVDCSPDAQTLLDSAELHGGAVRVDCSPDAQSLLDGAELHGGAVRVDCSPDAQSLPDGAEPCGNAARIDCTPDAQSLLDCAELVVRVREHENAAAAPRTAQAVLSFTGDAGKPVQLKLTLSGAVAFIGQACATPPQPKRHAPAACNTRLRREIAMHDDVDDPLSGLVSKDGADIVMSGLPQQASMGGSSCSNIDAPIESFMDVSSPVLAPLGVSVKLGAPLGEMPNEPVLECYLLINLRTSNAWVTTCPPDKF